MLLGNIRHYYSKRRAIYFFKALVSRLVGPAVKTSMEMDVDISRLHYCHLVPAMSMMILFLGGVMAVILITKRVVGIFLVVMCLLGSVTYYVVNSDRDYVLNCFSTELRIPEQYVIKQSTFFWIEFANGLDSSQCSIRIKFDVNDDLNLSADMFPHDLSTILHIDNPLRESQVPYLEIAAFERTGPYDNNPFHEDLIDGFVVGVESAIVSSLFEKRSNDSLRYVGSCSGYDEIVDSCIMRFSYRGIQFQYHLYRNQISRETYEKITLLLKTKTDSWLVN